MIKVMKSREMPAGDGEWAPAVTFGEATRHDLRLRVEFEVREIPASPVLFALICIHISC